MLSVCFEALLSAKDGKEKHRYFTHLAYKL